VLDYDRSSLDRNILHGQKVAIVKILRVHCGSFVAQLGRRNVPRDAVLPRVSLLSSYFFPFP
jgi:hypothetical protein